MISLDNPPWAGGKRARESEDGTQRPGKEEKRCGNLTHQTGAGRVGFCAVVSIERLKLLEVKVTTKNEIQASKRI